MHPRIFPEQAVRILEEIIPVIKPGQIVGFRCFDKPLCLPLRVHAPDQEEQDQCHYRQDHTGHKRQIIHDNIRKRQLRILGQITGQGGIYRRLRDHTGHSGKDRIQLRFSVPHCETVVDAETGGVGHQMLFLTLPCDIIIAVAADQNAVRHTVCHTRQAVSRRRIIHGGPVRIVIP